MLSVVLCLRFRFARAPVAVAAVSSSSLDSAATGVCSSPSLSTAQLSGVVHDGESSRNSGVRVVGEILRPSKTVTLGASVRCGEGRKGLLKMLDVDAVRERLMDEPSEADWSNAALRGEPLSGAVGRRDGSMIPSMRLRSVSSLNSDDAFSGMGESDERCFFAFSLPRIERGVRGDGKGSRRSRGGTGGTCSVEGLKSERSRLRERFVFMMLEKMLRVDLDLRGSRPEGWSRSVNELWASEGLEERLRVEVLGCREMAKDAKEDLWGMPNARDLGGGVGWNER